MTDTFDQKYSMEDGSFSIQYLNLKGYFNMAKCHDHSYYEIFYLLEGERIFLINNREYKVQKGDLVIINPHDPHLTISSEVPSYERMVIYFEPEFILPQCGELTQTLFPFVQGSQLLRFTLKEQIAIEQIIRNIFVECTEQITGYEPCVKSTLTLLLIQIHRHLHLENRQTDNCTHPMYEKIGEITSYIDSHYHEDITLDQIAKHFYISTSYLSRTFKKITGFSFREYLMEIRISEAKKLLSETQEKTVTIAEYVGFSSIPHFNMTFKKMVGATPLQYRKSHKSLHNNQPFAYKE